MRAPKIKERAVLLKLPNDDRIQVEHVERVTPPRKLAGSQLWTLQIYFASGSQISVDGDQDEVQSIHRKLISAMADRS